MSDAYKVEVERVSEVVEGVSLAIGRGYKRPEVICVCSWRGGVIYAIRDGGGGVDGVIYILIGEIPEGQSLAIDTVVTHYARNESWRR